MNYFCPTEKAVFLLGIPDQNGVLHFPQNFGAFPGLSFEPSARVPVHETLKKLIDDSCKATLTPNDYHIWWKIQLSLTSHADGKNNGNQQTTTLYLGRLHNSNLVADEWPVWKDLVGSLKEDRNRLIYLKALQALAGMLSHDFKVVTGKDAQINR